MAVGLTYRDQYSHPHWPLVFNPIIKFNWELHCYNSFTDFMLKTFTIPLGWCPSCVCEQKTQEPEMYSDPYLVAHNDGGSPSHASLLGLEENGSIGEYR